MVNTYLRHHGILGQKWGIRRFQNDDGSWTPAGEDRYGKGSTVKKGTKIYRVSNDQKDKTYDNKKYVSLTSEDHKKWQKYLGDDINKSGQQAYNIEYETKNDLKIADYQEVGKIFMEKHKDKMMRTKMLTDTRNAANALRYASNDPEDMLATNFAMQTETGKMFIEELMKKGYHGVQDRHGQNTADNPVIIFDPEKNLKRKKVYKYNS